MLWGDDHKRLEAKIDLLGCRIDCLTDAIFSLLIENKDNAELAKAGEALRTKTDALKTAMASVTQTPSQE